MDQKIKQTTGTCKYCGQSAMVKVPADWDQEQINEHVSEKVCRCVEGEERRRENQANDTAKNTLRNMFGRDSEEEPSDAETKLLTSIAEIAGGAYESISLKLNEEVTIAVKEKNGKIVINRTETIKDEAKI